MHMPYKNAYTSEFVLLAKYARTNTKWRLYQSQEFGKRWMSKVVTVQRVRKMTKEVRQKMIRLIAKYKKEGKSERWILSWKRGFKMADRVAK